MSKEELQAEMAALLAKPRAEWTDEEKARFTELAKMGVKAKPKAKEEPSAEEPAPAEAPAEGDDLQAEMEALLAKPKAEWTDEEKARFTELAKMGVKAKPKAKEEPAEEPAPAAAPAEGDDLQAEMAALLAKPRAEWTDEEKARFTELAKMGVKAKPKAKEEPAEEPAPAAADADEAVLSKLPEEFREFKKLMDLPKEKWTAKERVANAKFKKAGITEETLKEALERARAEAAPTAAVTLSPELEEFKKLIETPKEKWTAKERVAFAKFKKAGITEETLQEALSQAAPAEVELSPELQEFKKLMDLPKEKWTAKERVAFAKFKKAGITEETLQEALSQAAAPAGPRKGPEDEHAAVARLKEEHWDNITDISIPGNHMDEITVTVKREAIQEVGRFLKEDPACDMKLLSDLCGTDWPDNPDGRHCVVYLLYSITNNFRLRLKVWAKEGEPVPSVIDIWRTADWHEREAYDLYGVVFEGHPDLRRILMPDWWEGYPLRKDYPYEDRMTPRERLTKETYDPTAPYYLSTKGGEYPDSPMIRKVAKPGVTEYEGGPHGRPWEGTG